MDPLHDKSNCCLDLELEAESANGDGQRIYDLEGRRSVYNQVHKTEYNASATVKGRY